MSVATNFAAVLMSCAIACGLDEAGVCQETVDVEACERNLQAMELACQIENQCGYGCFGVVGPSVASEPPKTCQDVFELLSAFDKVGPDETPENPDELVVIPQGLYP